MNLSEFAAQDASALAALIAAGEITPTEAAIMAMRSIEAVNPALNAVVETYADRIEDLDESSLGDGPFRGVPFLMKDVFGHQAGRTMEFASRLCKGMVTGQDTCVYQRIVASGMNVIGRSNAPEYSMAGTTESALHGNTSNPWREGYSAGGSSGGATAAVMAGIVPMAHGSDIAGSIRIPAGWCGGVGLKPSRGRISYGPMLDEHGFGLATNFVQTRSVRDAATMLDWMGVPQTGDPFVIPGPEEPYAAFVGRPAGRCRIGWSVKPLMGVPVDPEIVETVKATAQLLQEMGHEVVEDDPEFDGLSSVRKFSDVWFFGFDHRLESYAAQSGRVIGSETLEPVILNIYEHAKSLTPGDFLAAMAELNRARRVLAEYYNRHDLWLGPTLARVAEPWGRYNLGREGITIDNYVPEILAVPCQFTVPHNILGTPAISLPLALHSSGLPIGVQIGAPASCEHVLIPIASALEEAMPWCDRVPPVHVSRA